MEIIQLTRSEENRWNELLLNSINGSFRQCMAYEYTKESKGRLINTFIFNQNGVDIAGAHYSIIGSKANIISVADITSGFIFRDEPDEALLSFLLKHFISWAEHKKVCFVRFIPWLPKTIENISTKYAQLFDNVMPSLKLKNISNGRHTYWIDLTLPEEQLINNMHPQTKRKIKKSLQSDVRLEIIDNPSDNELDSFWLLYERLGIKKGFSILEKEELKKEILALTSQGFGQLFILKYREEIINISFASNFGIATYYHGAINPDYQKIENCPPPGHISQWLMIKENKLRGIKTYDMAFCPGAIPFKEHPNYGIWRFKYEFGGKHVEFLPTYGKILKPIRGRIFKFLKYHS